MTRLLYCTQRYGAEVAGGAEAACRSMAERMAARGHDVHVVTSCALSYVEWADHYRPGISEEGGVTVHRLPVERPRDPTRFGALFPRVAGDTEAAWAVQRDWIRMMGPDIDGLGAWLEAEAGAFDVADFFTYLFTPSALGLRRAAPRLPCLLHPTAHDEPAFWVSIYDEMFASCDAVACLTEEEAELVDQRTGGRVDVRVLGLGVDTAVDGQGERFRATFDLDDRPYVLFLGRLDPGKGPDELYRFMTHRHDSGRTDVQLVVIGDPLVELSPHPAVVLCGYVDEQTKHDALAGATVFAQPSYFESFSLSLCEAWVHRCPGLVQARCAPLLGQARRSRGAIPYDGLAEFEAALDLLLGDPELRDRLGAAGRRYVEERYGWEQLLDRYEALLDELVLTRRRRHPARSHVARDRDRAVLRAAPS